MIRGKAGHDLGNSSNKAHFSLSIVVPVYKEEGNVPEFLHRISGILDSITSEYEIVFCLDPSPDRTEEVILQARQHDPRVKLIRFSRRFGQPMATLAGLQYASGDAAIVMDVDLQDPPELIHEMVQKWLDGFEVVYAQRRTREGETWIKKVVSVAGYKLINQIAEVEIPPNTGDFRLLSRRVVDEINRLKECHGFLRGMVALVGFKQTSVLFDRPPRFSGRGNYNRFLGSLRIGFNGLFCFSNRALGLSTQIGFIIAISAFLHWADLRLVETLRLSVSIGQSDHCHPGLVSRRHSTGQHWDLRGVHRQDLRRGSGTAPVYSGRGLRFRSVAWRNSTAKARHRKRTRETAWGAGESSE